MTQHKSEHFGQDGHNFEEDAEIYILESGSWNNAEERQCKESFYICKYSTLEPAGLNKKPGTLVTCTNRLMGKSEAHSCPGYDVKLPFL